MKISENKILNDDQIKALIVQNDYSSAADYLFSSQLSSWELMKRNYDALKNVQTKSFWFDGFKLKVQYNQERLHSTTANVDDNSIANRKCFLCANNLPKEQKGILIGDNFILLCNPFPIFPMHFTIAAVDHKPQSINEYFIEFLELSKLLSPKYTLIYNGPACGASAPDHLHFQAGSKQLIPIENDIQQLKNIFGKIIQKDELITTSLIDDGLRRIIFIESSDQLNIEKTFRIMFKEYKNLFSTEPEPMMNLICNYSQEFGWYLIVFLRSKHRPECFFQDEPGKLLISPAAIDLGGLVVTPREQDFKKIEKVLLEIIFNEVSLDKKTFSLLEEKLKSELN